MAFMPQRGLPAGRFDITGKLGGIRHNGGVTRRYADEKENERISFRSVHVRHKSAQL
jgi:hypothetical protein